MLRIVVAQLLDAGFILQRVLEPTPTERFERADHEKLSRTPGFLCVRAAKV